MTTPYDATDAPRGTDGTAYGRVIDANAYYNAPVADTAPTEAPTDNPEVVVDPNPALAGVGPQYGAADAEADGVDMATMPAFRDMHRMLPSERLKVQMSTAKLATSLPAHLKDAGAEGADFDNMTAEDIDALTRVITLAEETVLDNSADRGEMTEWLISQKEPINAVMTAFTTFTERLGN